MTVQYAHYSDHSANYYSDCSDSAGSYRNDYAANMRVARMVWEGINDPMDDAKECPRCGELPEWERDGKFSTRFRLNCCGINDFTRGHYKGREVDAVIAWNEAVTWEQEVIAWAEHEARREAKERADDAWVDENLSTAA